MNRKISIGLVVTCFLVMGIWDIYPSLTPEAGDTISEATRDIGYMFYTLPYVCGIVMGHFFFNKTDRSSRSIPTLWVTTGIFAARDSLQITTFQGGTPIAFILGVVAGSIWWPQALAKPGTLEQDKQDGNVQE
jgi:hypothetical protein